MCKSTHFLILLFIFLLFVPAYGQNNANQGVSDRELELLRKDLRSMKKQLVAASMQLTDAEAQKFWPVYDQYSTEITKINDSRYAVLRDYAASINDMSDEQAQSLAGRYNELDLAIVRLRETYLPMFAKAISGRKTARFFQLDRRLGLLIDLQAASETPIVQP